MTIPAKNIEEASDQPERKNISRGFLESIESPLSENDKVPVTYIEGKTEGENVCITACLHGNEYSTFQVINKIVEEVNPEDLAGNLFIFHCLNPASFRADTRNNPNYDTVRGSKDPNRSYPNPFNSSEPKKPQEKHNKKITEEIKDIADYYIDLHASHTQAGRGQAIRDVIYYEEKTPEELNSEINRMVEATGLPKVIMPATDRKSIDRQELEDLNNIFSTLPIIQDGIPSITVEVGSKIITDNEELKKRAESVKNILRELEILKTSRKELDFYDQSRFDEYMEFKVISSDRGGMVKPLKDLGEEFESGETVCEIVDSYGRTKETIEAEKPGLVDTYFGPMKVDEGQDVLWTSMETGQISEMIEIQDCN